MAQIGRIPRGWLNLIFAQTGGKTPSVTNEGVSPIITMDQFYMADRLSIEIQNFTPAAFPETNSIFVPPEQVWFLYYIGFSYGSQAAGDTQSALVELRRLPNNPGATGFAPIADFIDVKAAGGGIVRTARAKSLPYPLALQAGSELAVNALEGNALRSLTVTYVIGRLVG